MHFSPTAIAFVAALARVHADTAQVFIVNCNPLTTQRSDPLVDPGMPSGHVHTVAGGNAFSRNMAAADAAEVATATSCNVVTDASNYWTPALYHKRPDGQLDLVPYTGNNVYYLNRACNYTAGLNSCDPNQVPLAFPQGFRMIAGDSDRRTFDPSSAADQATRIMCADNPGIPDKETNAMPTTACKTFRAEVFFPSCWDGVNVDSANHKDHVAYPAIGSFEGGVCPESHPVGLISLFYEFFFTTTDYPDFTNFIWSNGDTTGYGYHGDFINGWKDLTVLQDALKCVGQTCPINAPVAQGGHRIAGSTPALITPPPTEDVGLNGPIPALPGNPGAGAPAAVPGSASAATPTAPSGSANAATPTAPSGGAGAAPPPAPSGSASATTAAAPSGSASAATAAAPPVHATVPTPAALPANAGTCGPDIDDSADSTPTTVAAPKGKHRRTHGRSFKRHQK
jgi:hypothetical protein